MNEAMALLLLVGGVLLLLGAPIWATIGLASASYIWVQDSPPT